MQAASSSLNCQILLRNDTEFLCRSPPDFQFPCYASHAPPAQVRSRTRAITTEIIMAPTFYYAEDYHQQYLAKPGSRECATGPAPHPRHHSCPSRARGTRVRESWWRMGERAERSLHPTPAHTNIGARAWSPCFDAVVPVPHSAPRRVSLCRYCGAQPTGAVLPPASEWAAKDLPPDLLPREDKS